MPQNKINILIIDNSPDITGAFVSIRNYVRLLKKDFSFFFCIDKNSRISDILRKDNHTFFKIRMIEISRNFSVFLYLPFLVYNTFLIHRFLKKNQIKILHVNDLYNMTGILLKILNPSIKLVYHIRLLSNSYASGFYKIWTFLIHKFSDQIIAVSHAVKDNFPYENDKIIVMADMVLPSGPVKNKSVSQNTPIKLLYVSNYIKGKGLDYAIEAFNKARAVYPEMSLDFIGGVLNKKRNISYKYSLQKKVADLGLTEKITFHEKKEKIENEYYKADILLNFSENESFSMTCLEALVYGIPIITSRSGGPEEIIEDRENGLLVPNRDIEAMKEAILLLASNPKLRESLVRQGKKKVEIHYKPEILSNRLRKLYLNLI